MSTYERKPEHMRAPDNLSKENIMKSLDELNSKIKMLQAKINATTVDSKNHYQEHISALEAKRELIAKKLDDPAADNTKGWTDLKAGIDELNNDIRRYDNI